MKIYLVGGAVRDTLLDRPVIEKDWVVTGATVAEMKSLGYQQVGKDFPVFLHPKTKEEYALARQERKTGPGYTGFEFEVDSTVTLEEDLLRRDLTVNAIAQDAEGKLIDPYNGVKDIECRQLRHVSDAFAEDPVRILRIARFAARYAYLGFTIAAETMELMRQMVKDGEVASLVPERIWKETSRALLETQPSVYIRVLRQCGALEVIFPEVDALYGVPQTQSYHPEVDTGKHLELALDRGKELSADLTTMYAILLHDLGKALTPEHILPGHRGHEEAGVPLVKHINKRLKIPAKEAQLAILMCRWHLHCHRALDLRPKTIAKLFNALDVWRKPEQLQSFVLACQADAQGRAGLKEKPYPQAEYLLYCANAARKVVVSDLVAQGYEGKDLGEEIHRSRVRKIAEARKPIQVLNI